MNHNEENDPFGRSEDLDEVYKNNWDKQLHDMMGWIPKPIEFMLTYKSKKDWGDSQTKWGNYRHIDNCYLSLPLWEKLKSGLPYVRCGVGYRDECGYRTLTIILFNHSKFGSIKIKNGIFLCSLQPIQTIEDMYNKRDDNNRNIFGNILKLLKERKCTSFIERMETVYEGDFLKINVVKSSETKIGENLFVRDNELYIVKRVYE
tara:strand:- start:233 stop:844 length:612 start_codon:yes stop_codon:yes gene_type:complete